MSETRRVLYHSKISSYDALERVADIAKVGRVFTKKNGISGLLVFDGSRFCEYLEGPLQPMHELMARISADERHLNMHIVLDAPLLGPRAFQQWAVAFAAGDDDEGVLAAIETLQGEEALAYFLSLRPSLEVL